MSKVWLALSFFGVLHVVAFGFVYAAARHTQPGESGAAWRYLFVGHRIASKCLTAEGLRLAARARAISWFAFMVSALVLIFG